jgi:ATP-dependent helicase/nuclease subunit B
VAAELGFGPGHARRGLEVELGDGRKLVLRGEIDRMDVGRDERGRSGVMVVDYKSGARSFNFGRFYHGLDLQLMSYLAVAGQENQRSKIKDQKWGKTESAEGQQSVGAVYWGVQSQGKSREGMPPERVLRGEGGETAEHRARGVINGEWTAALDETAGPGQASRFFGFYVNKDGSAQNRRSASVVNAEQMAGLLRHNEETLRRLAGQIVAGEIGVRPYRYDRESPCGKCEYAAVCRFDFRTDSYRDLAAYGKEEALGLMRM